MVEQGFEPSSSKWGDDGYLSLYYRVTIVIMAQKKEKSTLSGIVEDRKETFL